MLPELLVYTGTSGDRYRNTALEGRYVTGTYPNLTHRSLTSWATNRPTNLEIKQDGASLLVHQMSRHFDLWCGRTRLLDILVVFARNTVRVPVAICLKYHNFVACIVCEFMNSHTVCMLISVIFTFIFGLIEWDAYNSIRHDLHGVTIFPFQLFSHPELALLQSLSRRVTRKYTYE